MPVFFGSKITEQLPDMFLAVVPAKCSFRQLESSVDAKLFFMNRERL
jgi:hypothetical protein